MVGYIKLTADESRDVSPRPSVISVTSVDESVGNRGGSLSGNQAITTSRIKTRALLLRGTSPPGQMNKESGRASYSAIVRLGLCAGATEKMRTEGK